MNINKLIKRVKDHLGMSKYLSTSYDDKAIFDIIKEHAIPDWSYYFRYEYEPELVEFNPSCIVGPDLIALPDYFTDIIKRSGLKIMDIKKIRFQNFINGTVSDSLSLMTTNYDRLSRDAFFAGMDVANRQGNWDMLSTYKYSGWYESPNMMRFNYPVFDVKRYGPNTEILNNVKMSVFLNVNENLVSISPTREPYFIELCRLHVMKVIYENEVKYMESISSGQGNINLKVDEWANAGERIKELLKQLEGFSTLSQHGSMII